MPPRSDLPLILVSSAVLCVGAYFHLQILSELRKSRKQGSSCNQKKLSKPDTRVTKPPQQKNLVVDDLVCPITLHLPINPVTAEDGRVYEKSAIENHFATKREGALKSPLTRQVIGTRLLPAPQHRNIIESLIESRAMTGDLADKWMEKAKEKKNMECLMKRAETGDDVEAMETVATHYFKGENGFPEDDQQSYAWFQRAHRIGSVVGTAHMGYMLASGVGVTRNKREGIVYLGVAAGKGSDMAAYRLGMAWADGKYGLSINDAEAISWLQLSLRGDCNCKTMNDKSTKKAQQKLDEVLNRSSASNRLSLDPPLN